MPNSPSKVYSNSPSKVYTNSPEVILLEKLLELDFEKEPLFVLSWNKIQIIYFLFYFGLGITLFSYDSRQSAHIQKLPFYHWIATTSMPFKYSNKDMFLSFKIKFVKGWSIYRYIKFAYRWQSIFNFQTKTVQNSRHLFFLIQMLSW